MRNLTNNEVNVVAGGEGFLGDGALQSAETGAFLGFVAYLCRQRLDFVSAASVGMAVGLAVYGVERVVAKVEKYFSTPNETVTVEVK